MTRVNAAYKIGIQFILSYSYVDQVPTGRGYGPVRTLLQYRTLASYANK